MDEMTKTLGEWAVAIAKFHTTLLKNNVPATQAVKITEAMIKALVENSNKDQSGSVLNVIRS